MVARWSQRPWGRLGVEDGRKGKVGERVPKQRAQEWQRCSTFLTLRMFVTGWLSSDRELPGSGVCLLALPEVGGHKGRVLLTRLHHPQNYQWPLYHVPPSSLITKPHFFLFFFFNAFLFVCFGWEACRILVPWPRWNRSLQQRKHKAQSQTSPMPHPLSVRSFSHLSHFYFQCSILHLSVENLLT